MHIQNYIQKCMHIVFFIYAFIYLYICFYILFQTKSLKRYIKECIFIYERMHEIFPTYELYCSLDDQYSLEPIPELVNEQSEINIKI